jgi:hypothetical protein
LEIKQEPHHRAGPLPHQRGAHDCVAQQQRVMRSAATTPAMACSSASPRRGGTPSCGEAKHCRKVRVKATRDPNSRPAPVFHLSKHQVRCFSTVLA